MPPSAPAGGNTLQYRFRAKKVVDACCCVSNIVQCKRNAGISTGKVGRIAPNFPRVPASPQVQMLNTKVDVMKVAVIGGGSTYTPELVEGLLQSESSIGEIALMDIDARKLAIVGGLAQRMAQAAQAQTVVTLTGDRAAALDGAGVVIAQLRIGGLDARILDERIPMSFGLIGQETTGPGGMLKALRTIPVMLDIKREMQSRCPDAWLINFTNPSGLVCEALRLSGQDRYLGLCNFPLTVKMKTAQALGVAESRIELDYFGLNHLSWARVLVDGVDRTDALIELIIANPAYHDLPGYAFDAALLRELQLIPSGYLRYYYRREAMVREQAQQVQTRGEKVKELEASLLEQYADPAVQRKPDGLQQRGGAWYSTAALRVLRDLCSTQGGAHVLNVPNGQAIAVLTPEAIVEVPAQVGAGTVCSLSGAVDAHGVTRSGFQLPPSLLTLLMRVKSYELLAAAAALAGSRDVAAAALRQHPLLDHHHHLIPALLDKMLLANRDLLPNFFPSASYRSSFA